MGFTDGLDAADLEWCGGGWVQSRRDLRSELYTLVVFSAIFCPTAYNLDVVLLLMALY